MDYQIVFKHQPMIILWFMLSSLHCAFAIVNRDLVLTPKQGLQLSGKRIFYDENTYMVEATLRNSSNSAAARPWERTLKHVTYLTLFTNAATGIITGNYSKVKEYNDFLQSPYIRSPNPNDSRFGDIVTLAQGRLETMTNGTSYRFVEGNCDYECARANNMVATWHVQKIRHRDVDRKFHYEMKFSVSPMTMAIPSETVVRGGPNKRTIMESTPYKGHNSIQTFIQKEDDYPHSFSKIRSHNQDDEDFAERRYDGSRNFRQVNQQHQQQQHHQQVTPMPQSTFLTGVYRPAPPTSQMTGNSPFPDHLNIGEYYKGSYGPKASPKIELFPNLLTMMFGKPPNFPPKHPTTYRPPTVYQQMKFPRPDVYSPPTPPPPNHLFAHRQEYSKLPEYYHSHEQFTSQEPHNPVISHHYHHHYFMANSTDSGEEQSANGAEEQDVTPAELYKNAVHVVTPMPHFTHAYDVHQQQQQQRQHDSNMGGQYIMPQYHQQQLQHHHQQQQFHKMPPAPQKFVFPITEIEQHRVVHVTPVSPLKKPQYQQYYQPLSPVQYTTGRGPLVVYPAPVEEEKADVPTPRNKPFVQSQPLKEEDIRYSEPDPLYAHITEKPQDEEVYGVQQAEQSEGGEPQLELPQNYDHQIEHETEANDDSTKEQSDSVEAQVQSPHQKSNIKKYYENVNNDDADDDDDHHHIQEEASTQQAKRNPERFEQKASHSTNRKIATEKTTEHSKETEASYTTTVTSTVKPKVLPTRAKRIRLKVTKLVTSTTPKPKIFSTKVTTEKEFTPTSSTTTTTSTTTTSTTTAKPQKQFVSTSTTESPLKSLSRYRSSNKRLSTTTEKPVLKWKPRRKEANAKALTLKNIAKEVPEVHKHNKDNDDNNTKASIREVTKVAALPPSPPTLATTERTSEPVTEMSNDVTTATASTMSSQMSLATEPPSTTSETEIYEVLTQKSVSYKIGENGREIPITFNDVENEVKV